MSSQPNLRQGGQPAAANHKRPFANVNQKGPRKDSAPAKPAEKWVVVIKNVENDFARVHAKAVERFCCLNPAASMDASSVRSKHQETTNADAVVESNDAAGVPPVVHSPATNTVAKFRIVPRTETRSAEVLVYAPTADSDISDVWQMPPRPEVKAPSTDDAVPEASVATSKAVSPFSSVGDMISVLRLKPYFTHPPLFVENSEVMRGEKSFAVSRKRSRNDSEDNVEDGDTKNEAQEGEDADEEESQTTGPKVLIGGPQNEFVTVHIVSSAATNVRNLKKILSNGMPGFVTCWWLRPLHFRAVFVNEKALFHAKELLDQFDAEGLKLNLILPDSTARRYEAYLARDTDSAL